MNTKNVITHPFTLASAAVSLVALSAATTFVITHPADMTTDRPDQGIQALPPAYGSNQVQPASAQSQTAWEQRPKAPENSAQDPRPDLPSADYFSPGSDFDTGDAVLITLAPAFEFDGGMEQVPAGSAGIISNLDNASSPLYDLIYGFNEARFLETHGINVLGLDEGFLFNHGLLYEPVTYDYNSYIAGESVDFYNLDFSSYRLQNLIDADDSLFYTNGRLPELDY